MRSAVLQGPAFDAEARRPQGRVFSWIDRMLRAPHAHDGPPSAGGPLRSLGPSKAAVASAALLNMLSANHDVLPVYVHQCYSAEPAIACTYFQALSKHYLQQPHATCLPKPCPSRVIALPHHMPQCQPSHIGCNARSHLFTSRQVFVLVAYWQQTGLAPETSPGFALCRL